MVASILYLISQTAQSQSFETHCDFDSTRLAWALFEVHTIDFIQIKPGPHGQTSLIVDGAFNKFGMEKLLTKSDKISDDIKIALSLRDTSWTEIKCYEPRHGIVGRDKEGGIVWYIEICFECRNMRVFGRIEPRFAAKYLCQEQFALLRTLFLPEESPPAADKKRKKPR